MPYLKLLDILEHHSMNELSSLLKKKSLTFFENINHGDFQKWSYAVNNLPSISASEFDLNKDIIVIGNENDCSASERRLLKKQLKCLMPWRKGPFSIFGLYVNAEWRCNMKWNRLQDNIKSLKNKLVLDVGCGNGYYGWRMLGDEAKYVVGIDPSLLFYNQFTAIKKYIPNCNIDFIPWGIDELPDMELYFDTVFSMGVIYHRRDPIKHLKKLSTCLKSNGEIIIESLVIDSHNLDVLIPEESYAKMKNVWAIPSLKLLIKWIDDAGFKNARIIDTTKTTRREQRVTEWMQYESLGDFLCKKNNNMTIEGYPCPIRAIVIADMP